MEPIQIIVLAWVQGMTEFFPVSSSAHLILIPYWFHWPTQGLAFDVAVHLGTLAAVLIYFRPRVYTLLCHPFGRLAQQVVIATLPALMVGALFHNTIDILRAPVYIAVNTLCFGILLGIADWRGKRQYAFEHLTWKDIVLIGIAQTLALIPGVSRSGITITTALFLGYTRRASAEFSFLLSMPVIAAAGCHTGVSMWLSGAVLHWESLLSGAIIAFVSAYVCIHTFFLLLDRLSLQWFVAYRVLLAAALFYQIL